MSQLNNFMDWDNPGTAFITGASSGIGAAFVRELANQNFNIVLVARRKEKLEAIASELKKNQGIKVQILVADLSKFEEIERLYSYITKLDDIDVLINNAGFGTKGYFDSIPIGPQRDMLFVHNVAPVYFSRAALPIMIKRGRGVIINVSSLAAFTYRPQSVMYSSTKTFLKVFTEILNMELDDTGVKVQALCPGYTITEFHEVGDYKDYDRSSIPESAWMPAKEVVKLSLKAVSEDKVVFIPGKHNQAFIKLYTDPKLGQRTRKNMIKAKKIPREPL